MSTSVASMRPLLLANPSGSLAGWSDFHPKYPATPAASTSGTSSHFRQAPDRFGPPPEDPRDGSLRVGCCAGGGCVVATDGPTPRSGLAIGPNPPQGAVPIRTRCGWPGSVTTR